MATKRKVTKKQELATYDKRSAYPPGLTRLRININSHYGKHCGRSENRVLYFYVMDMVEILADMRRRLEETLMDEATGLDGMVLVGTVPHLVECAVARRKVLECVVDNHTECTCGSMPKRPKRQRGS